MGDNHKTNYSVSHVINLIKSRKGDLRDRKPPFILGVSGIQGAGKTTLVRLMIRNFYLENFKTHSIPNECAGNQSKVILPLNQAQSLLQRSIHFLTNTTRFQSFTRCSTQSHTA